MTTRARYLYSYQLTELLQLTAAAASPCGLTTQRPLCSYIIDAYFLIDIAAITFVLTITSDMLLDAWPKALTVFFVLLKMISHLRVFEEFGFLVSMVVL